MHITSQIFFSLKTSSVRIKVQLFLLNKAFVVKACLATKIAEPPQKYCIKLY